MRVADPNRVKFGTGALADNDVEKGRSLLRVDHASKDESKNSAGASWAARPPPQGLPDGRVTVPSSSGRSIERMKLGLIPLSVLVGFVALLWTRLQETHPNHVFQFQILAAFSIAGYFLTMRLIPVVSVMCVEKGDLWGKDINKIGDSKMYVTLEICLDFFFVYCV